MAKNHKKLAPYTPPSPFLSKHLSTTSPPPISGPKTAIVTHEQESNVTGVMPSGRDFNPNHLHPAFLESLEALLLRLKEEEIPFFLYEGYRDNVRQAYLHSQNRSSCRKGYSLHQYGLAADLALLINGKVTWERTPDLSPYWDALETMAEQYSLKLIEEEGERGPAHVECTFTDIESVLKGLLPSPGVEGREWWENLTGH